jgi:hypothetical protein
LAVAIFLHWRGNDLDTPLRRICEELSPVVEDLVSWRPLHCRFHIMGVDDASLTFVADNIEPSLGN